ncbi:bifunctional tRNA (5-methylaminomethyl-2-thiouridine)(34)-methyltransferase MnmD/FAD-dependent 5-carboxymethylaminomethyl-2-thiouridine(34) oxidoreductase MnmC [Rheinheimera sp. UJ51]|uniref:bifunctional tRNA (5-methylaminomethyl-2-thiouridine)(34)-methyltransferase MnmD/FAD-dependent 5-carboxymethylaminomethyl-2-thiouridine(34) oxidoreductase MnmC n=1 Tax=Rheinheimera sp. UJ51 TaxID=2892446 RepID=UPI001E38B848|nr:bifunctional tRNA (5-methylaminomethyl-2-thiouridine)(34)-methyltransferase MnmD/FAD-dependent 5-carboxymethylaminomethyl-2-thiouridine(34) oxidoreductase MnmC [Rheinheimera sp. UJ51]MCC5451621.1 bifunctional tRNA (5-methylaminomethyl-2-thiouridine)(34)-methyltransferase MnmD/FAD-dependent 5-carboxymethylaminomethyl-2-thiouridine(34) oxidoreductase MnmC [Rheinheimera sp. UJ51]
MQPLSNARIHFNQQGAPVASDFEDIYFSDEGGLGETDYVFLQQNGLPERWLQQSKTYFHVLETGFGTGANFLVCWQRFQQFRAQNPSAPCQRLYFSSVEKFPISATDLQKALACHHELAEFSQALLEAYPPAVAGCHRLVFAEGQVILDLWLGDANDLLPQFPTDHQVDAIFLDGFAPSKNPEMWQVSLFEQLFRLAAPKCTLATFTCAGIVKRGLQQAGFQIKKVKGYGRKREMLTASVPAEHQLEKAHSISQRTAAISHITIIGGGLAALCSAAALLKRGIKVQLLCADADVAQRASHNRQGALYPNLTVQPTAASLLHCHAFHYAKQFYQHYHAIGLDFPLQFCGMLHLATTAHLATRQQKMAAKASWPNNLVNFVDAAEASSLAGIALQHSGIFLPAAGWLGPQAFCQALLAHLQQQQGFEVRFNCHVTALHPLATGWQIETAEHTFNAEHLLVATGADIGQLAPLAALPVNRVRGQVSHVQAPEISPLRTVICHKGYLTPAWQGEHSVGATFDRDGQIAQTTTEDDQQNIAELQQQLGQPAWSSAITAISAKAAFRATVPDRLPIVGQMAALKNLWVMTGLGARGLLYAPLLAELLACQLSAEPLPQGSHAIAQLAANRFNKD